MHDRAPQPGSAARPLTCIIGAGSSGMVAAKALADHGLPYDQFEASDRVGGNWAFDNPNGMSSAYDTLHINTSRERMSYADLPMSDAYSTFPHHTEVNAYLNDYVDHFGLRDGITFRTTVQRCAPEYDGTWTVTLDTGETRRYDAVLVANGHHWDPRWPDPPFPGEFSGEELHAHHYRRTSQVAGRRVVIVGMGNSAMDIATVASYVSESVVVAARTPTHVLPKWVFGRPFDQVSTLPLPPGVSYRVKQAAVHAMLAVARGPMSRYGLPEPTQGVLESHPTVSSDFLVRAGHGAIDVRPNVARFDGEVVTFADSSTTTADLVVYATGYNITFPFLDDDLLGGADNQVGLYRMVVPPHLPGLFVIGLAQPLGAIFPIAERQAKWVAGIIAGRIHLPDPAAMQAHVDAVAVRMARRYTHRPRHTIQVDFDEHMLELNLERARGRLRALRPGGRPQVPARVGRAQPRSR